MTKVQGKLRKKQGKKQMNRNLKLFFWFQAFREPVMWGPIAILFAQEVAGMKSEQIYFMEGIVVLCFTFLQFLTGAFADRFGNKKAIMIGVVLLLFDQLLFASAMNPMGIWIANFTWVIGFSFVSGADQSYLRNLKDEVKGNYTELNSKSVSWRFFLAIFSCVAAGWLYEIHPRLPVYLAAIPLFINIFIVWNFKDYGVSAQKQRYWTITKDALRKAAQSSEIRWVIAFSTFIAVVSKLWFMGYNPYFKLVELDVRYYGVLFAVMNAIAFVVTRVAHKHQESFQKKRISLAIVGLLSVPIFLMGTFVTTLSVLFPLMQNLVRGFKEPFINNLVEKRISQKDNHIQSTMFSLGSSAESLGFFILSTLGAGKLVSEFGLTSFFQILGLAALVAGVILVFWQRRVFKN